MTHNIFVVAWNNLMSILSLNNGDSTTTMDKIYHKPDLLSSIKSHPSSKIVAYKTPSKYSLSRHPTSIPQFPHGLSTSYSFIFV